MGTFLFRNTFKKEELEGFDMLFLPTKNMYNQFIMLLEKLLLATLMTNFSTRSSGTGWVMMENEGFNVMLKRMAECGYVFGCKG